jgi:SP family arabinose:H+ symporter-like MFS transporter
VGETGKTGYVLFLGSTAALGGLLFGFDIAIITGAGPYLAKQFGLTDLGLGWAFSSLLFGCALGCVIAARMADRWGRKKLLLFIALLFAVTSIETALAPNFTAFVSARFLAGLAVGGVSLLSPMYLAEVSPASMRGRLGTMYQLSIIIGILISFGLNYLLRNTGGSNWRWMFLTGVVPSAVFFVFVSIAPETPRFLAMNQREREALIVLESIGGTAEAQLQLEEIRSSFHVESRNWRGLTRSGVRRAVVVSMVLAILIHVSGINTIIDYAPAIFQSAGWKIDSALGSTFLVGITEFLFTLVSFWVIDRLGRKPLYIVGSFGMGIALLALTVAVLAGKFHGSVVLVLILAYIAFFAACIGPVFWTLIPEIFPNDMRGLAMTFPVLTQWIANAMVVLLFPLAFHVIGKAETFSFLMLMALAQGVFTWICVPETRNKSLEEMERQWEGTAEMAIKRRLI